ncbi:response regulator transcription factor [Loktanella agnita]|uniref:response regulator transcription factor n=1 Tax=Loktanella agnita TaxID=287097 RepID=UPI003985CBE0
MIIEDSDILRENMAMGLRKAGYVVETAADGEDGLWRAEARNHDVLILDLGLPKLDGMDVLQRLRAAGDTAPVLILTARDGVDDRVAGLQAGADDYLVKPFDFAELMARIEALLRRSYGASVNVVKVGDLEVDTSARQARLGGVMLTLARREYALLEVLVLNAGAVVSRADIEARIYDEHVEPNSNVVDAAMSILRKKLDQPGVPSRIETRRGEGYRLCKP